MTLGALGDDKAPMTGNEQQLDIVSSSVNTYCSFYYLKFSVIILDYNVFLYRISRVGVGVEREVVKGGGWG